MKKLTAVLGVAVVAVVICTVVLAAKDRNTRIVFTHNYNTSGSIKSECIGIVDTETLPGQPTESVTWKIVSSHDQGHDDDCKNLDNSSVELHFTNETVFGVMTLKPNGSSDMIKANISANARNGAYKYTVWYKGKLAGPDPEIEIGCSECGPGPGGPGH